MDLGDIRIQATGHVHDDMASPGPISPSEKDNTEEKETSQKDDEE